MPRTTEEKSYRESLLRRIAQGLVAYRDHLTSEIKCLEVNSGIVDLKRDLRDTRKAIKAIMELIFDSVRNQTLYTESDIYATVPTFLLRKINNATNIDLSDIIASIEESERPSQTDIDIEMEEDGDINHDDESDTSFHDEECGDMDEGEFDECACNDDIYDAEDAYQE